MRRAAHPAKYHDRLLVVFARLLNKWEAKSVLDPMAGTCKIAQVREHGWNGRIVCNEIEPEWALQGEGLVEIHIGDAAHMDWAQDNEFDAIITSPTYGNRMADHHDAKDGSRRYTYKHMLGRDLHPENTGQMQWGDQYRRKHEEIWKECIRVLKPGGLLVVVVKDHIRNGKRQHVSLWHVATLRRLGCRYVGRLKVDLPGMRNGANRELRVDHEDVWVLEKQKEGKSC